MKQLSRIFLTLALLVPALAVADSCDNSCGTTTSCNTACSDNGCNNSCNQSACFNSCTTSVCNTSCESSCYCPSILIKRPTYDNTVLYYGLPYQHLHDMDQVYGGFQIAFEYQRSFNASKLARGLFGTNVLSFSGSQVPVRGANDLIADNFGLSTTFEGTLALKPVIQDFNLHFDGFVGFDEWCQGLYMQLDMNFDYQKRELQSDCSCSTSSTTTTIPFPAGYMSASTAAVTPIADIQTALGLQGTFGDKKMATTYGRFDFCDRTESGLAGLSVNLGYDFLRCDDYFLGAFFRVVAPTGSKAKPCYVFDAIVGNGKGWEVGAGISGRWEMWNSNDCQKLTAMLDGYVTSVLKHHSLRTFDLASTNTAIARDYTCNTSCGNNSCGNNNSCNTTCNTSCNNTNSCDTGCSATNASCGNNTNSCNNGCNGINAANCLTRYELLKQYNLVNGVYTYASNLITAADFTTRNVDVRTPVKGDATLRLVYTHGGFDLGFGYNIFGMVREKISSVGGPNTCLFTTTGTTVYAVKGCRGVAYNSYAATGGVINTPVVFTSVPLINSASKSTAYTCASIDNPVTIASTATAFNVAFNSNANNANIVGGTSIASLEAAGAGYIAPATSGIAGASSLVLTGSANELDLCSGTAPRQFTNKGFVSLDYTWVDNDWAPYLGFIAEVEGGSRNTDVAQWGLVVRGGVSY